MAKDINGNYVPNVPLWPALWLMGNDQLNNSWVGWPYCAEIDVMEWSPTKPSNYETKLMLRITGMELIPQVTIIGKLRLITLILKFILDFINGG